MADRKPVESHDHEEHRCPRCGSKSWVSVSLNGGYTRIAQCVPCGAYGDYLGPGWKAGG
jgi:transcription elongation factor Elf1